MKFAFARLHNWINPAAIELGGFYEDLMLFLIYFFHQKNKKMVVHCWTPSLHVFLSRAALMTGSAQLGRNAAYVETVRGSVIHKLNQDSALSSKENPALWS